MSDWFEQHANDDQKAWVAALESGKYRQTKKFLHRKSGGYCCLGVACQIFLGEPDDFEVRGTEAFGVWQHNKEEAPRFIVEKLHLCSPLGRPNARFFGSSFGQINDSGRRFKTIAKMIRETPWFWLSNIPRPGDAA